MNYLRELFETSVKKWHLSTRTGYYLFWTPLILTLVAIATRLNKELFRRLLEVAGPVEWLGVLFFIGSAVFGFLISIKRFQAGHPWQGVLFIGFGFAMIFAAGEESAWGQQLFDYGTPERLAEINYKDELSLHNIDGLQGLTNLVIMLVGLYGAGAYLVNRRLRLERYWDQADYLYFPPLFLINFFVWLFLFRLFRFIITESNFTLNRIPEWLEMQAAAGIFIFVWLIYRRLAAGHDAVSAPTPATSDAIAAEPVGDADM